MMMFMDDPSKMSLQFPQALLVSTLSSSVYQKNLRSVFIAQFLYTRESRAAPSLSSFIDTSSGGGGISRSISEPYQSPSKSKPTTSPLVSSSVSASTATREKRIGKLYAGSWSMVVGQCQYPVCMCMG